MGLMVFIYLVTGLVYIYVGAFSFIYDPKNKLNRIFSILCLNLALWAIMFSITNAVSDVETAMVFIRIASIFQSMVYCLFLHFILILTGKDGFLKKPVNYVILYIPAICCIYLYYFNSQITRDSFIKTQAGWIYSIEWTGSIFSSLLLPAYFLVYSSICIFLLYKWGNESSIKRIKHQAKIIVSTIVMVLVLGTVTDILLPVLRIGRLPALMVTLNLIPVYGIWYSNKRFRLLNLDPRNVFLDVIENLGEGMIITNHDNIIQDINNGALKMLGYTLDELAGKHITIIMKNSRDISKANPGNKKEINLVKKCGDLLPVLLTSSSLFDEWGEVYGNVFVFQDLTEIKQIQMELKKSHDELERKVYERTKELNMANEELRNEIKSRIEMEQEIRKLAYYDQLTGLPNKKLFMNYLDKKIHENLRNELTLAVMCLDLDSFKMINDTMGYAKGEELLKQVAERLLKSLKKSDTVARVAGDEFLILIQNNPDGRTIDVVASKLNRIFHKPFIVSGNEVHVTASIGVAIYPIDGEDADTLVKNADIAMYRAKEKGKNKYEICTPLMRQNLVETMKFTNNLYRAVSRKEFNLLYQPQVNIETGEIVGFEALIRWNHPELGIIHPNKFIPIGEKTGLIIPISEWVFENACRQNKEWQEKCGIYVPMAVNLSPKQLIDSDLVNVVSEILKKTGLSPCFLELEITESALLEEIDIIRDTLVELSKMGVRITIDDFGTRYSSLNYLKQLPINRVKIDISFVQGITVNHKDEAIINAIIDLARKLDIDILAEGVETFPQMNFLRNLSCNIIQGFYLYRPMDPGRVYELLLNSRR
jgi:diguanylate cyclase (GGDEF)-like protein/PAS domain S-box-containing protein